MVSIWPWVTQAKPLALSTLTTPPLDTTPLKTLNSLEAKSSVMSTISMSNRVSGLSMPQRFITSSNGMRGNGVGTSMSSAVFQTRFSRPSIRL